jgi:hypothetical protein
MKSIIRSLVIFTAGAGSAAVVAGLYPDEPISPELFQERAIKVLAEVEALGGYVAIAQDGRVGIYTNVGACVPPVPIPKWPAHSVDPRSLELGLAALGSMNKGLLAEEPAPVYVVGKCRPYASSLFKY